MAESNLTTDLEAVNPLVKHAYACSEPHLSGYRLVIGFETLEQVQAAHRYVAKLAHDYLKAQEAKQAAEYRPFTWILYDGRAASGDTDDAAVLETFSSRRDLRSNLLRTWRGHDGVLFEYDVQNGNQLVNERMLGHLREGKALLAKCSRREESHV